MIPTRRTFIKNLIAFTATAPAIVRASSLMPVKSLERLSFCPPDIRVGGWFKPFCVFKPNVNPAYAWEPVIFRGGRKRDRTQPTVRDWLTCNITLKKGLTGAKPEKVCEWIISLLGASRDEDTFSDIFPGTGVFGRVWNKTSSPPPTKVVR